MMLPQPVTVARVPGRSRASTPGVTSMIGVIPLMGEARWTTATSKLKFTGSQRGWMSMAAARRFWPWVLVSTVRPTTTRRSLSGTMPGSSPMNSTQCAAVRTSNGVIRLPPQYWRSKSLLPNDWASRAAWNLYFPLGTGWPPTIFGVIAPGPWTGHGDRP
jgi:hypothetical protein